MEEKAKKLILPRESRKAVAINPKVSLFYSQIKAGKTTIAAQLPNSLLIELGAESADFVDANTIKANNPNEFEAILKQIIAEDCPYDYVIVDSTSIMDEWSEIVGTLEYMDKNQGRRFNRDEKGQKLHPRDPRFETVHSLANGAGYMHSRNKMNEWYNLINKTAPHIILLAHLKDKYVESKTGDTVEASDINLTGRVKQNYCVRADAVGHMYRKGDEAYIKFDNEFSSVCGGRCKHLKGDILISKKLEDDSVETYWENIYLKE